MSKPSVPTGAANTATGKADSPRLVLRTYKASDHDQVDHLFYSTYFTLVPEGVKSKLKSIKFWVLWLMFYFYLLSLIPVVLSGMNWPQWAHTLLNLFISFAWFVVSFAGIFVYTDRFEVVDKVEQARQNDLSDPEIYYLNWTKQEVVCNDDNHVENNCSDGKSERDHLVETDSSHDMNDKPTNNKKKKRVTFDKNAKPATEIVRIQKPVNQQTPSHFWVLCLDNRPCGMIGLAHYNERLYSNRPLQPPAWKLMLAALFDRYHISAPAFLSNLHASMPIPVFAEPHEQGVATLQRLAVRSEFQNCGLSTILIDRAMSYAFEKNLQRVEAKTNELETKAADILKEHHGFKLVKKVRTGWFGQYEKVWTCDVKKWMDTHEDRAKTYLKNNVKS